MFNKNLKAVFLFLFIFLFGINNIFSQTPPDCTDPTAPADGATDVAVDGILAWFPAPGATGYKIYFGSDGGGTADPTDIENGTDIGNVTSYDYSGSPLAYFSIYYWKIVPYNADGDAIGCNIWEFTTEPDPNLPACSTPVNPTDGEIDIPISGQLEWNSVTNADGYKIWFGTDGGGTADPTDIENGTDLLTATTYDYSGVKALQYNTVYYWKIVPYNANGDAMGCQIWEFTTVPGPQPPNCSTPIQPVDLATGVAISGTLEWDPVLDADGYKIFFGTDGGGTVDPTTLENGTDLLAVTTYDYSGVKALTYGTVYYWKIVPYNAQGDAIGCDIWEFTTEPDPNLPDCTTPIQPSDGDTYVSISDLLVWFPVTEATGYKIWFGTDGGGTIDPTDIENGKDIGNVTSYDYSGVKALNYGTVYYWKIVPYNASGDAFGCQIWQFTTEPDPNLPPCATLVEPADASTGTDINGNLMWNTVPGAAGYKIWFGTDGGGINDPTSIENGTNLANDTSYTFFSLSFNTTYYWKVVPYNLFGDAFDCQIWSFTTTDDTNPPGCAVLISPTYAQDSVAVNGMLEWAPSFGSSGFKIWLYTDGQGFYDPDTLEWGTDLGYVLTYNYNNLKYGVRYFWKIVPYNANGDAIGCVNWLFYTIPDPLPPICTTLVSPADSANGLNHNGYLRWNRVDGAKGYKICLGSDGAGVDNPSNIQDSTDVGLVFEFIYSNLDWLQTYYWKIIPYNESGEAIGCEIWEFTIMDNPNPPDCTTPDRPDDGAVGVSQAGYIIWNTAPRATGYKLYFGTDGGGVDNPTNIHNGLDIGYTNSYNYTVNNLVYGQTYYWKVVPYNSNGDAVDCPIWTFEVVDKIDITNPRIGDLWIVGSVQDITWSINSKNKSITRVDIQYSTNNGASWTAIIENIPANLGRYPWTVPNTPSEECRIQIVNVDNLGNFDISDIFKIDVLDFLSVVHPNGGEKLGVGTQQTIRWNSSGVDSIKIEYRPGPTWLTVTESVSAADGEYLWIIPNTPTTQAKLRMTDTANPALTDESNSTFWLIPYVEIIKPADGDTLTGFTNYDITWNTGGFDYITMLYSEDGGNVWKNIVTQYTASLGVFTWQVPNRDIDSCIIFAKDANDPVPTIFTYSGIFTIRKDTVVVGLELFNNDKPVEFKLYQNFPNPFNPTTEIRYSIAEESFVSLKIYNVLGEEVKTLVNEYKSVGNYKKTFDASSLRSGIYIYRVQAGNFVDVKKMILVK